MDKTASSAALMLSLCGPAELYQAIPSGEEARQWHRHFTSVPHPATSKANDEQAEYIAEQWRQQGLEDVVIRRYDVLSSNPRQIKVEKVAPRKGRNGLRGDGRTRRLAGRFC